MERLNYDVLKKSGYDGYVLKDAPEKVLQFGEGNFLRAFVDYWFDLANEKAGWNGKCCLVQPIAPGLAKMINEQEGLYTLYLRGSENGKNVGLDESSAAGCNITFSDPLFNDSGVCYFTITPKEGYTLSDSYTVKVGTEVLSAKNNYNAKTGQWFFWSNKIMTDYTIHVEGVSPAA